MKRFNWMLPVLGMLVLSGCAHAISDEGHRLVDPAITFSRLRENPDAQLGKYVLVGGSIAGVKNSKEGAQLEIVQADLDSSDAPTNIYHSDGRFLATSPALLDPFIYKPGRLVTIVGEVKGQRTMPLDEVEYTYPVIAIREIYLWKEYAVEYGYPYPLPSIYYNYDPYYWGYAPGSYWYRPMGPVLRR